MIEFLEVLFAGSFCVFWHLTIHVPVYAECELVENLQVILSGSINKVDIKNSLHKTHAQKQRVQTVVEAAYILFIWPAKNN